MSQQTRVLINKSYGNPESVVALSTYSLPVLMENQLMVEQRFSPINPADINMIEGKYYTQPELPAVLGNEGVGVVTHIGPDVKNVSIGDHVILPYKKKSRWIGAWAEQFIANEEEVLVVPKNISLEQASMLTVNPPTAFLILQQFTHLEEGDWIIQNAANSSVGQWINYIADEWGISVLNVVRSESAAKQVQLFGKSKTMIESEQLSESIKADIGKVKLVINAVGGNCAEQIATCLDVDGVMVTYGAMSRQPFSLSNGALIYKNIWSTGFNRSKWVEESHAIEIKSVYDDIFKLLEKKAFEIPIEKVYGIASYQDALNHAQKPSRTGKVLLQFN